MKRILSLILSILLCGIWLVGCDEPENKNPENTTDAITTKASPSLIDALNADNFINVTMEAKSTVKEDDVEQPVEITTVYKFIEGAVEMSSSIADIGTLAYNTPEIVAENRKNIDLFQVPFLEAAKNGKFEYDSDAVCYNLTDDITYRLDFSGEIMDILYSNAVVKLDETGKIAEIVAEMRMTFPNRPDENSGLTLTMRFSNYGTTVVDESLFQQPLVSVPVD